MPGSTVTGQMGIDLYLHVRVLISIILGLSVTRLVGGVAGFIQHPDRNKIWLIHFGWVVWALLNVFTFWWWEFRLIFITQWSFGLYLFVCFYASMYFFMSTLLFPQDMVDYAGYRDYFMSRRQWFFGLIAFTEALDVVDTWIKGDEHLRSLGTEYLVRIAVFIMLCGVAARTRNLKFHTAFVFGGLLYQASFFGRYYFTLN